MTVYEIVTPGGLPAGMREEIYQQRQIDWMRETCAAVVVGKGQGEVDKFRKWYLDITPEH